MHAYARIHYIRLNMFEHTQYLYLWIQPHTLDMRLRASNISKHTHNLPMYTTTKSNTPTYRANYVPTVYKQTAALEEINHSPYHIVAWDQARPEGKNRSLVKRCGRPAARKTDMSSLRSLAYLGHF